MPRISVGNFERSETIYNVWEVPISKKKMRALKRAGVDMSLLPKNPMSIMITLKPCPKYMRKHGTSVLRPRSKRARFAKGEAPAILESLKNATVALDV